MLKINLYFPCCFAVQIMNKEGALMNNSKLIFFDLPQGRVPYCIFLANVNSNLPKPGFKLVFFFYHIMELKINGALYIF